MYATSSRWDGDRHNEQYQMNDKRDDVGGHRDVGLAVTLEMHGVEKFPDCIHRHSKYSATHGDGFDLIRFLFDF